MDTATPKRWKSKKNGLDLGEVFAHRMRKVEALRWTGIYPPDYRPSEEVFGEIVGGERWTSPGSFYVANPHLLAVETDTKALSWPHAVVLFGGGDAAKVEFASSFRPGRVDVAYQGDAGNNWFFMSDKLRESRGESGKRAIWLRFANARDAGFCCGHVDWARSLNISPPSSGSSFGQILREAVEFKSRFARDYSSDGEYAYAWLADDESESSAIWVEENWKPVRIFIKLWRDPPSAPDAPEDLAYVISASPNPGMLTYKLNGEIFAFFVLFACWAILAVVAIVELIAYVRRRRLRSAAFEPDVAAILSFEFRGNAREFFRVWIVNFLLTVITLGVFSAWAKVRTRRYFYGNLFLDGANFHYDARPATILAARLALFALLFLGLYLSGSAAAEQRATLALSTVVALLLPWAAARGMAFNARYSSHCGLRFSFRGRLAPAYWIALPATAAFWAMRFYNTEFADWHEARKPDALPARILWPTVASLAAVFLSALPLPWLARAWHQFKAGAHALGGASFLFASPPVSRYWRALWPALFSPIILCSLLFVFYGLTLLESDLKEDHDMSAGWLLIKFATIMLAGAVIPALMAYFLIRARLFHLYWNNLRFAFPNGAVGKVRADFFPADFAWRILFVNFIATVLSFGLLHPWAKVRRARYLAERMTFEVPQGAAESFAAARAKDGGALAHELDADQGFDFDVGLI